jgi:hypothetical protein
METCILFCCFGMTDKNEIELPRFVPSYYARDLINKLQQLKQGAKSVEEYYQELQIGMLCCNLEEREDAAMARFFAGLNHEIQDILEYKDYANITHLFHFACKAEREMQGHHASANTIFFLQEELIHGSATMDVSPTISFTKSGGTFYIQQQQQALSCCYKFSNSGALSNKEYPTTRRVYCILKQSERHPMSPLQRVWTCYA